jgi:hypothetical protein
MIAWIPSQSRRYHFHPPHCHVPKGASAEAAVGTSKLVLDAWLDLVHVHAEECRPQEQEDTTGWVKRV